MPVVFLRFRVVLTLFLRDFLSTFGTSPRWTGNLHNHSDLENPTRIYKSIFWTPEGHFFSGMSQNPKLPNFRCAVSKLSRIVNAKAWTGGSIYICIYIYRSIISARAGNRNILTSLEHLLFIFQFSLAGLSGLSTTDRTSRRFPPNKSATGSKASKPFREGQWSDTIKKGLQNVFLNLSLWQGSLPQPFATSAEIGLGASWVLTKAPNLFTVQLDWC